MINNRDLESTIVSTRVRLARNIAGYPFPSKLKNTEQAKEIIRLVNTEASRVGVFNLYFMDAVSDIVARCLMEDHLISADLIANKKYGAALIDEEEKFSIMINEEDHLREQYLLRGFRLNRAYEKISAMDDMLSKSIRFAYDKQLGYLTACPTNLGTGLRASVMLFLPGLTRLNKMNNLIHHISRLGLTVRGVYGEGSVAEGYMYQISNEVTLGVEEETILSEVENAVLEVVGLEARAREQLVKNDLIGVKDDCRRSFGILTNCEKVSFKEFLQLISNVKLGAALGYVPSAIYPRSTTLIVAVRPANINLFSDREVSELEQNVCRAAKCTSALLEAAK